MSDNPYPDGDGMKLNMGRNTMNYELHTAWDEGYAEGFAAGRAAATPDPPDAYTACVEALAEWWTGEATAAEVTGWMNGALQAARLPELDREAAISMCNMVMADLRGECDYGAVVSNVLRAAYPAATPDPPTGHPVKYKHGSPVISDDPAAASPDERLREAVAALPQYVITIQDREGYTYERGCEGQPMNYTGVMLADVEALVGKLKDGATTARETTNELKDAAADREKPEGCRAPHCFSEYGTPCGTCPAEKPETP